MSKRDKIIKDYQRSGAELVSDNGKVLIFRSKFNVGWFLLWFFVGLFVWFLPVILYLVYHFFLKQKVYEPYKR